MNLRERFLEVMIDFRRDVGPPKWELAYWGAAIDNWYKSGLPKKNYPIIPKDISTPTVSLYNTAWNSAKSGKLPGGIGVLSGLWPTQNFPTDTDVRDYLGMDKRSEVVDVNLLFYPMFDVEIIEEDEDYLLYIDIDGVKRKYMKKSGVIPTSVEMTIKDRKSWEKVKSERLNLDNIKERFAADWNEVLKIYKNRDFPLVLGGYPYGYFGTLAHLMGYENLFFNYSDNPGLIHDIQRTFTDLWIAVYEEVLSQTDIDMFFIWEDISAGTGSMVNPSAIREFMLPYYKRLTGFLKEHGVKVIIVDTDGYCFDIIPLFIEGGITGLLPIEVSCGMDLVKVRGNFPYLQIIGGIPKFEIKYGKERINQILEPVADVLKQGGYIPTADHFIPPEIEWEDFKYYRKKLNNIIDNLMKPQGSI